MLPVNKALQRHLVSEYSTCHLKISWVFYYLMNYCAIHLARLDHLYVYKQLYVRNKTCVSWRFPSSKHEHFSGFQFQFCPLNIFDPVITPAVCATHIPVSVSKLWHYSFKRRRWTDFGSRGSINGGGNRVRRDCGISLCVCVF